MENRHIYIYSYFLQSLKTLILFLVLLLVAIFFSIHGVDTHHDGIMFKPALDVAQGKTLFRETFTQYGAFSTILQAWALEIFGPYLVTIKVFTAFCYALIGLLLLQIWKELISPPLAFLSVVLWFVFCPFFVSTAFAWSTVYALVFVLISTLFLIRFVKSNKIIQIFYAGIFAGLVFWTRQPTGVVFLLTIGLYLVLVVGAGLRLRLRLSNTLYFLSGWICVTIAFVGWILLNKSFGDFWLQSIKFSLLFNEAFGASSILNFASIFFPYPYNKWNGGYLWNIFPLSAIICMTIFCWQFFVKKFISKKIKIQLLIAVVSLSLWHIYYPFPDFMKASWGSSLMVGFLPLALSYFVAFIQNKKIELFANTLLIAGICYLPINTRISDSQRFIHENSIEISRPEVLKGMMVGSEKLSDIEAFSDCVESYLSRHPGSRLINATTDALYATFTTAGDNFHPAHVKWTLLQYIIYPNYQKELLNYVASKKPLIAIYIPPNSESTDIGIMGSYVFNGEERFDGYEILCPLKGGLTVIAPLSDRRE